MNTFTNQEIKDLFDGDYPEVFTIIENSILSADAKRSYTLDYKYRLSTLRKHE